MELRQDPNPTPEHDNGTTGFLQSGTAKIVMVGLLTLVLLIPLQYVKNLIFERSERQKSVTTEIGQKWGSSVYFYGPVLKVPYKTFTDTQVTDSKTNAVTTQRSYYTDYAYFFPDELKTKADVTTEKKNRDNYQSVVFTSKINIKGHYSSPNFSAQGIAPEDILWEKAAVVINTNSLRNIKGNVAINLNGRKIAFEPVAGEERNDSLVSLETPALNLKEAFAGNSLPFDLNIAYNGSKQISMVPIGKLTETTMASNWADPNFTDTFLPESKKITDNGFTASWKISQLNRPFAQQYFGSLPNLKDYKYTVDFKILVDEYQKNERASKYGFLIIGLTFLIFFLIQTISKINIHIFQYGMIGLALIMFYTLLISITEHSSFKLAYIIAGLAVVIMVGLYSISILKDKRFPAFIAASLTALYTFIYVIIQLENYALLAGSIGLFLILGAVMYFSRKIDWKQ
jgi:inner membrane protein